MKISLALVLVVVSAITLSDLLGLITDAEKTEIGSRKLLDEVLAVQYSLVASK